MSSGNAPQLIERSDMSQSIRWRDRIAAVSLAVVILNPIYWIAFVSIAPRFHPSDKIWGNFIATGFLIGVGSLICGLFGKGSRRLGLVVAAFVETFFWWFMAIGL